MRTLAALALLSASAYAAAAPASSAESKLNPTAAWWEKVTLTIAGDGKTQSCTFETSTRPADTKNCEVVGKAAPSAAIAADGASTKDQLTRLTFERRFHPGAIAPADGNLQAGDTLLGRQVMSLAIDAAGSVKGCKVVATSGDVTPEYSCNDAAAEHFEASAKAAAAAPLQGFMTILVYGHAEHVV
jgi:hypothetical protein